MKQTAVTAADLPDPSLLTIRRYLTVVSHDAWTLISA